MKVDKLDVTNEVDSNVSLAIPVLTAYLAANGNQPPADPSQLSSFASTPEEKTALRQLMNTFPTMSEEEKSGVMKQVADFQAGAR